MNTEFDPFAGGEILRVSPTTDPQKEIVASAHISDEANTAFNEAVSVAIEGPLDVDLLQSSLAVLVRRHDVLRSTFSRSGEELCLAESSDFRLRVRDLRQLDPGVQRNERSDLWMNIAISPMNLEEGPLFFAWLLQIDDARSELVLAVHHLVCDGWSFGVLLTELAQIYSAGAADAELTAAPSYLDFAEQQDATQISNADIDYWRERFAEPPPALDLPLDKTRPTVRPFSAARLDFEVESEIADQLRSAAAQMKVSLSNLLMASYLCFLYRLSGNEDLVVGLPLAGQAALGRPGQVGHMVQLLPIRVQLEPSNSLRELAEQVKAAVLDGSEHANFTFGKLLENLKVDRSRVPLVSTMFNVDQPMPPLAFGSAVATVESIPRSAENFELFLNVVPSDHRLCIEITYSTALFSPGTIKAWLHAYQEILRAAIAGETKSLRELRLKSELPSIVQAGNQTQGSVPFADFTTAFADVVRRSPDRPAVVCGDRTTTYQELDRAVRGLVSSLARLDLPPASVVGISCERSELMVAAALAVMRYGGAYLPLDPELPDERLAYMLSDSGAAAVIKDQSAPSAISESSLPLIELEAIEPIEDAGHHELPEDKGLAGNRPAYLIYTSGSTGKPKGVSVSAGAMMNFLHAMSETPGCAEDDRLLAVTTMSFDISILELFLPLYAGACCVVATKDDLKDGDRLAALVKTEDITMLQATPSTWRMLLASSWNNDSEPHQTRLKALCGGEPMPQDLVEKLLPRVKQLWNMYGPTEATVWSSSKRIEVATEPVSIGHPIANTEMFVLDENQSALPLAVPGELYIGGLGLALGYHDRPELTADRFLNHPEFGRIYRTGDSALVSASGEFFHLGRLDDQVKLRGFRIELGEIEAALVKCEGVAAAAAYLWQLSPSDVRIVGCCVPVAGQALQSIAVRKALRDRLPQYMLPQYLLSVDSIPLSSSGKVDRRSLPRPEIAESTILSEAVLANETERELARIWAEIIHPSGAIGRDDNFFDIGGHSLLALEAIRQTESLTGVRLTAGDMVSQRLEALAQKVMSAKQSEPARDSRPASLRVQDLARLSVEQERIFRRQVNQPTVTCNNLPAAWVLEGPLDVEVFRRSLSRLWDRQSALRTVVKEVEGELLQGIRHLNDLEILVEQDFCSEADPRAHAIAQAKHFAAESFDMRGSPLVRCALFRRSPESWRFGRGPHQRICGGWSFV
ncbi:MAG: amino acid adenylation domain-containing protein, partial [Pseudomonadota bacterium]